MQKLSKVGWCYSENTGFVVNRKGELVCEVYKLYESVSSDLIPTQHKNIEQKNKVGHLICDAPLLLSKLELIIDLYAKGIKPTVTFIKDIEKLIQKHS